MLTDKQVQELKEQITHNYEELRKYHVQKLLNEKGLTPGCRIKTGDKIYQLSTFDELCQYNDLRSYHPYLYGRLIKKNGELGKVVNTIYIYRDFEIVG